jgi:type IV secretory pathway VirB10-like protein
MAFRWKRSKTSPAKPPDSNDTDMGELELPVGEDPGVVPGTNIYRTELPKGIRFNQKKVVVLLITAAIVIMFSIMNALTPQKPGNKSNAVTASWRPGEQNSSLHPANPPEEITKYPNTYKEQSVLGAPLSPFGGTGLTGNGLSPGNDLSVPPSQLGYGYSQTETPAGRALQEARQSAIRFGGSPAWSGSDPAQSADQALTGLSSLNQPAITGELGGDRQPDDPNGQNHKNTFLNQARSSKFYAGSSLTEALSPYEVKAGSIIPGVLITGINSDLPGRITGQVRENVYDSVTGRYLLIPQGTKIIGIYDSRIVYAQNRVLIVWSRLIFPNGNSLDLEGLSGVDGGGYTGFKDQVNYHTGRLTAGVLLSSILSAGTKVANGSDGDDVSFKALAAEGAAENVANVGAKYADRNLNVQPTIEIRPGFRFNILVDRDFILKPYEG